MLFSITDHVAIPWRVESLSCSLERLFESMKMSNFERKYSPGYCNMICCWKTKSTSKQGLFFSLLLGQAMARIINLSILSQWSTQTLNFSGSLIFCLLYFHSCSDKGHQANCIGCNRNCRRGHGNVIYQLLCLPSFKI